MDGHLGYEKHEKSAVNNNRNGKIRTRVKFEDGQFELVHPVTEKALLSLSLSKSTHSVSLQ